MPYPDESPALPATSPSVVLLAGSGPLAALVCNGLARSLGRIVIIEEEPERKWHILKRRAKLLGWPTAIGQTALTLLQKLPAHGRQHRIGEIAANADLALVPDASVEIYRVPSVNSGQCRRLLAALQPQVVAVFGTRLINRATLASVDAPFINYHAGINPKYRGQHPGYWALVEGDPEHAGVTIHLIDEGVDTGSVLYQAPVAFDVEDSILTYQYVQAVAALPLFAQAIRDALAGRLNPKPVDLPSRQWFPPTAWGYFTTGLTRGVW